VEKVYKISDLYRRRLIWGETREDLVWVSGFKTPEKGSKRSWRFPEGKGFEGRLGKEELENEKVYQRKSFGRQEASARRQGSAR